MASLHRIELRLKMLPTLPSVMSDWWAPLLPENVSRRTAKKCDELLYHTIELARNALECSDDALVIASVSPNEMTKFLSDSGPGLDPGFALHHSRGGGFGFRHALSFADAFTVEVSGKRYEKRNNGLVYVGKGHVRCGTRIILSKAFPTT